MCKENIEERMLVSERKNSLGECVIYDHPVPPEELGRYSISRDPAAEEDIANYVHWQTNDEVVQHVEKVNPPVA